MPPFFNKHKDTSPPEPTAETKSKHVDFPIPQVASPDELPVNGVGSAVVPAISIPQPEPLNNDELDTSKRLDAAFKSIGDAKSDFAKYKDSKAVKIVNKSGEMLNAITTDVSSAQSYASPLKPVYESDAMKFVRDGVNALVDSLPGVLKALDEVANIHPFIKIAVGAFRVVVELDLKRRDNDKKIAAMFLQMKDMMEALLQLRSIKDRESIGPDGMSIEGRMQRLVKQTADDITACGNACDAYSKKRLVVKVIKGSLWEGTLKGYIDLFAQRRKSFTFELSVHTGLGVDDANLKLDTLDSKMNVLLEFFTTTMTPEFKELSVLVQKKGGARAVMDSNEALKEMLEFKASSATTTSKRGERDGPDHNSYLGKDSNLDLLKLELFESPEVAIKKNFEVFERKLKMQQREIMEEMRGAVHHEGDRIINAFLSGPHNRIIDPDIHAIWKEMNWPGHVKARHFVLALRDYYREQFEMKKKSKATGSDAPQSVTSTISDDDEWALEWITVNKLQSIAEAFDDDASGFITIAEVNQFTAARPQGWSLPHWIAYWAIGWQITATYYRSKIITLFSKMFAMQAIPHDETKASKTIFQLADKILPSPAVQSNPAPPDTKVSVVEGSLEGAPPEEIPVEPTPTPGKASEDALVVAVSAEEPPVADVTPAETHPEDELSKGSSDAVDPPQEEQTPTPIKELPILPANSRAVEMYLRGVYKRVCTLTSSFVCAHESDALQARFQSYIDSEEQRLRVGLETVKYDIDAMDTLTLITGPGRIEKYLFPLLYLLLKRDFEIFRLCRKMVVHKDELWDSADTIVWVLDAVDIRHNDLETLFKQQNLDPKQQFKAHANELFDYWHDDKKFWSLENLRVWEFDECEYRDADEDQDIDPSKLLNYPSAADSLYKTVEEPVTDNDVQADDDVRVILGRWNGLIGAERWPITAIISFSFCASADHSSYEASDTAAHGTTYTILGGYKKMEGGSVEYHFKRTYSARLKKTYFKGTLEDDGETLSGSWGYEEDDKPYRFIFKRIPPEVLIARPPLQEFEENKIRALWKYALTAVHNEVRRKMFSWSLLKERRDIRKEYLELLERETDSASTSEDLDRFAVLDRTATCEDIRTFYVLKDYNQRPVPRQSADCDACGQSIHGARLMCLKCGSDWTLDFCDKPACREATKTRPDCPEPHVPTHDFVKVRRAIHQHREIGKILRMSDANLVHSRKLVDKALQAAEAAEKTGDEKTDEPKTKNQGREAAYSSDSESEEEKLIVPTCVSCSVSVSYPCWYCIDCIGTDVFVCHDCDEKLGGISKGNHKAMHSLILCKEKVEEVKDGEAGKNTEQRLSAVESQLGALSTQMERIEKLLELLATSRTTES